MPKIPSRFLLPATFSIAALCSLNLLTGCAAIDVAAPTAAATAAPTALTIHGSIHGGQNPVGGSLVQLWETGVGAVSTATATASVTGGSVSGITVNAPGYGYTSTPTVKITGGGAGVTTPATATANLANGTVTSITINNGGAGYTTTPTVSITGGVAPGGYGVGSKQLVASTTSAAGNGAYSFPTANVSGNCTAGPTAYITASGGDPSGVTATNINPSILMMAVIGPCSSTGASTNVIVSEVTTVAAAYALSGFVVDNGGTISIGAPSTNAQGLADAVANAGLLASAASGNANVSSASMVLPTAMLNSLANSLAACVNVNTLNNTATNSCTNLFTYTTPPGSTTAPTDTFQAAVNMAKYPGSNVSNILNLAVSTASPFVPGVSITTASTTTAPNDLTLAISYPNTTLQQAAYNNYVSSANANNPIGFAIDGSDNLWSVGATNGTLDTTHYNYISELTSPSSNPLYTNLLGSSAALDGTHTLRTAAFDTLGNLWLSDKNATGGSLIEIPSGSAPSAATELTAFSSLTIAAPNTGSLDPNDWWIAIDASNNLWTASYGGAGNCTTGTTGTAGTVCDYVEYTKGGTASAPTYTATDSFNGNLVGIPTSRGGVVDTVSSSSGLGNVWATAYGIFGGTTAGTAVEVMTPSNGALATITLGSTAARPQGVALDAAGNGWITTNATTATSGLWKVPQGTVTGTISAIVPTTGQAALTTIPTTGSSPASTATTAVPIGGINTPGYDAVDGAGNIWVANNKYGTVVEYSPSLAAYLSPYYGFSPSLTTSPAVTTTVAQVTLVSTTGANLYAPSNISVGQTVTLSNFTGTYTCLNGGPYPVTALGSTVSSYFSITLSTCTAASKTTTSGTVTVNSSNQALFTCSGTSTITCTVNTGPIPSNTYISVDRAGTVWSMPQNGTLTGIIGTAAPTNPVLAAGQNGILP